MHPWVKGIPVSSNEGSCRFPRGENNEIAKIHKRDIKIFFSRTFWPISTKHGTNILGWREFKFLQMKVHVFYNEIKKINRRKFKSSDEESLGRFQAHFWLKWTQEPFNSRKGDLKFVFLSLILVQS